MGATLLLASGAEARQRGVVVSIPLAGAIDPAAERWMADALDDARTRGAEAVIVRLDTPGGLDDSTRAIVQRILAAPMPVFVYVYPDGARAASAGLFVTLAADVAAMAPQTNIGSATPISIGHGDQGDEVLGLKVRNDSAAYARALAEAHHRDAELADRIVRYGLNVTASRAEESGLVDRIASSERALVARLDGFEVRGPKARTLDTDGWRIDRREPPLQYDALRLIVNPTIAYLLLLAGVLALAIEVISPGLVGPGALGAVALALGIYGTAQLPVTVAGVILLVLAFGLLIAETQTGSGHILGVAGIAALIAGGLLLFDTDSDEVAISAPVVIAAGALMGSAVLLAASEALAARHPRPAVGDDDLRGAIGTVRVPLQPVGQVYVRGVLWRARSADPDTTIPAGERVEIDGIDGQTLRARPAAPSPNTHHQGNAP